MKKLITLLLCVVAFQLSAQTFDILIKNGKIIDGSGNPWYYGDIGIRGGKIASIGKLMTASGKKVIDASGLTLAPGFIDVHTHIESGEFATPTADNFIYDGVTSVITGNCGGSNLSVGAYFKKIDSTKLSINVGTLIGHNTVRRAAMGDLQRDPTKEEQQKMEQLVAKAMQEGAVGLSTGLIYVPGTYSKTPEVVGLAKSAASFGGVYVSHIRDEAEHVVDAINEAINIGRQAKMPVEISHFKVTYKPNFGRSKETLALVESARKEGLDVTIDQYPYVASSTTLDTQVPTWAFGGGRDSLLWRMKDPATRKRMKDEMLNELQKNKLLNSYSYAVIARYPPDSSWNGKNISEVNLLKGRKANPSDEIETILDIVGGASRTQMVFYSMDEGDVSRIMQYPFSMIASDAGVVKFGSGVPHPRAYGTNARVLSRYVNEKKVIYWEEAIRRMTSLPAQKFQLRDRGLLREGMAADVLVINTNEVGDAATFSRPHAFSTGFRHVIVNGELVIENGKHTGKRSGQVLLGPGSKK